MKALRVRTDETSNWEKAKVATSFLNNKPLTTTSNKSYLYPTKIIYFSLPFLHYIIFHIKTLIFDYNLTYDFSYTLDLSRH